MTLNLSKLNSLISLNTHSENKNMCSWNVVGYWMQDVMTSRREMIIGALV